MSVGMAEVKVRTLPVRTSYGDWTCRIWGWVRLLVLGRFGSQSRPEGYGRRLNPILELGWVDGELVLMGRNQTMRRLLQGRGLAIEAGHARVTRNWLDGVCRLGGPTR